MQKAKDRSRNGGKEKAAEYYIVNKEVLKENVKNKCRNFSKEEKKAKREYGGNRYRSMTDDKTKIKLKEYQKNYQAAKN